MGSHFRINGLGFNYVDPRVPFVFVDKWFNNNGWAFQFLHDALETCHASKKLTTVAINTCPLGPHWFRSTWRRHQWYRLCPSVSYRAFNGRWGSRDWKFGGRRLLGLGSTTRRCVFHCSILFFFSFPPWVKNKTLNKFYKFFFYVNNWGNVFVS